MINNKVIKGVYPSTQNRSTTERISAPDRLFASEIASQYFFDSSPNILICGAPRSGKTSIIEVMFYKISPHETLSYTPSSSTCFHSICHTPLFRCTVIDFLNIHPSSPLYYSQHNANSNMVGNSFFSAHSATALQTENEISSINKSHGKVTNTMFSPYHNDSLSNPRPQYEGTNTPSQQKISNQIDASLDQLFFTNIASIIFIVDAQNDPLGTDLTQAKDIFKRAWKYNQKVKFEIFIHKVDGDIFATDEVRSECQQAIHDKLMAILDEEKVNNADVMFYSTSIYDHTIFEAFSRVMQNLTKHLYAYNQLLDTLVTKCKMERAFLLDTHTKAFIATDSSSFDPFNYELCSEIIDVMVELSCIYGDSSTGSQPNALKSEEKSEVSSLGPTPSCLISLTSEHILYLKEIDKFVALACTIREQNFDRQYLIDYNIKVFKDALNRLIKHS